LLSDLFLAGVTGIASARVFRRRWPGEAEARGGTMSQPARNTDRKQTLASVLETRLEQGYQIESQNGTQAIIVMKGRKRMFRASSQSRQLVTIDEQGHPNFNKMD
jgi:hypothetical protein